MRCAVLGAGLIGSGAARHLALAGHDVTLIGPREPGDWEAHQGVFASHYDEGRITRRLDASPFWSEVSVASLARYAEIEAASGISFFSEVGGIFACPDVSPITRTAKAARIDYERIVAHEAVALGYHLPTSVSVLYEPAIAGHVSPRRLVAAQQKAAQKAGAGILREVVGSVEGGRVMTDLGTHDFEQVLWAAGGFGAPHLDLPLSVEARTVAYFEVAETDAPSPPTLILKDGGLIEIYLLPPIRFPNGKTYWKIGGAPNGQRLRTEAEMRAWFQSGGDAEVAQSLSAIFHTLVPDADVLSEHHAPCVTTYMPDDMPAIGRIDDHVCVATAGNGRGAKCSDELGRLGAMALMGEVDPALDPLRFQ